MKNKIRIIWLSLSLLIMSPIVIAGNENEDLKRQQSPVDVEKALQMLSSNNEFHPIYIL